MRAGPLSDEKIIARLNAEFVNAWILRKDLMRLSQQDDLLGAFAAKVLQRYAYPVDSVVFDAGGVYRGHLPANDPGAVSVHGYAGLLDSAAGSK